MDVLLFKAQVRVHYKDQDPKLRFAQFAVQCLDFGPRIIFIQLESSPIVYVKKVLNLKVGHIN